MRQPFDKREKKRIVFLVTLALFIVLLWLAFSPNGFLNYYGLKTSAAKLRIKNQNVAKKNDELQRENARIEKDPAYIEELARTKYNMVKENEIVIEFNKKKKRH